MLGDIDYIELMTDPGFEKILDYHPEVRTLFRCRDKLAEPIEINGVNPILHVAMEAVAYNAVNRGEPGAVRQAFERLRKEGLSEHAALAGIGRVILAEIHSTLFDEALRQRRLTGRLNLLSTRKLKFPERNEPCPCGSGLKFKKCCLPIADVFYVNQSAGKLELGIGYYVTSHCLPDKPEDWPVYILENRAHIAEYLEESGLIEEARNAFEENYREALNLGDDAYVENALYDLLTLCLNHRELSQAGIEYGRKLLSVVKEPAAKATIECDIADLIGRANGFEEGEREFQRLIMENPGSWFIRYRRALYLLEHGRRDEAKQVLLQITSQGKDSGEEAVQWASEVLESEFGSDEDNGSDSRLGSQRR